MKLKSKAHLPLCRPMIFCVCTTLRAHPDPKCLRRVSALCPVSVECEHGFDVCPKCDPCTCRKKKP